MAFFFYQMPLEITRSFVQNRDGTFDLFKCPKVEVENIAETYGRLEKQPIRPLELKTFLKVGMFCEGASVRRQVKTINVSWWLLETLIVFNDILKF